MSPVWPPVGEPVAVPPVESWPSLAVPLFRAGAAAAVLGGAAVGVLVVGGSEAQEDGSSEEDGPAAGVGGRGLALVGAGLEPQAEGS